MLLQPQRLSKGGGSVAGMTDSPDPDLFLKSPVRDSPAEAPPEPPFILRHLTLLLRASFPEQEG